MPPKQKFLTADNPTGIRCFLCPNKDPIILCEAVKCPSCVSYYHRSCSETKRAGRNTDGSFIKCCGDKKVISSAKANSSVVENNELQKQTDGDDLSGRITYIEQTSSLGTFSESFLNNGNREDDALENSSLANEPSGNVSISTLNDLLSNLWDKIRTNAESNTTKLENRINEQIIKETNAVKSEVINLKASIESFDYRLSSVESKLSQLEIKGKEADTLKDDINLCKADMAEIKTSIEKSCSQTSDSTFSMSVDEYCNEMRDRDRRSKNLILLNVPDSSDDTDSSIIRSYLSKIPNFGSPSFTCKRLGKIVPNKLRPTLITFESASFVIMVLKSKDKLTKPVIAKPDLSEYQRKQLSDLREQLDTLNKIKPNSKTIKYVKNIPQIVDVDPTVLPFSESVSSPAGSVQNAKN